MHHEHGQRHARLLRRGAQHLQLVVDGVPVVVAVDERRVDGREGGQHVVADVPVEDVSAGELLLVLGWVELGRGVDDMQLRVRSEMVEHERSRLAAQRADLDDPRRSDGVEDRGDDNVPERKHDVLRALPLRAGRYQNAAGAFRESHRPTRQNCRISGENSSQLSPGSDSHPCSIGSLQFERRPRNRPLSSANLSAATKSPRSSSSGRKTTRSRLSSPGDREASLRAPTRRVGSCRMRYTSPRQELTGGVGESAMYRQPALTSGRWQTRVTSRAL